MAVSLLAAACGGNDDEAQPTTSSQASVSSVYDVRLHPSSAVLADQSAPGRQTYRVSLPVDGLANFYWVVAEMGDNMAFEGPDGELEWCSGSRTETPPRGWERVWRKPNTNDFLVLQGTEDGPASILTVIDDKANPTRTCVPA